MDLELAEEAIKPWDRNPSVRRMEAMLLFLFSEDKVSVAWAGELLGLDRISAIR